MGWRDVIRKGSCMAKQGEPCDCSMCAKQDFEKNLFDKSGRKPDFLDLDNDKNTNEPMAEAAKDAEKKAKCPHCDWDAPRSKCICGGKHNHR